ncbi:hypothetical protein KFL_002110235 [Klebsormidium nitens]|uniref:BTB domain-containing protein n=1 Tax=Klebsormidium nitens TaxID=105231 RepID=A0A1Y1I896_KLENI|nr:hypothetical protein KFL_002110235 [Klebsormidium nitens]|eukprot:GAQ84906.1 hypothetical protein KFL_002110235 [Klebsormidium nitens]
MLSNGMKESNKTTPVTLMVTQSERAAFKEMLHFLYAGTLSPQLQEPSTPMSSFVDLLVVADKFEVPSLMGAIIKYLRACNLDVASGVEILSLIPKALADRPGFKHVADLARACM